jgi:GTP-binding protein HflX
LASTSQLVVAPDSVRDRAILVGVWNRQRDSQEQAQEYLDELTLLADTAGADAVATMMQALNVPVNATYIGSGKVDEIKRLIDERKATLVLFDDDLSPSQVRNLEEAFERRVLDRSGLILKIFSERARTAQARTQVELAQLQYLLPRLTRMWGHLSRERGGIGLKGAGEQEIETDRRVIREKILKLKEELKKIDRQAVTRRKHRAPMVRVALVGYTNAGKSTIMNLLAKADVFAENKLFATLDTTVRKVVWQGVPFLLSDTVGFIRKLPHGLIESFKSTLDEVREADVLLHVADISSAHYLEHVSVVRQTLAELGASEIPTIMVFNKLDRLLDSPEGPDDLADLERTWTAHAHLPAVFISATQKEGLDQLRTALLTLVRQQYIAKYPGVDGQYGFSATETAMAEWDETFH